MARKRKPLRFPKGHPKAGQFASKSQLARLKAKKKKPAARIPRELREAIEFERETRIPWRTIDSLKNKLRIAIEEAGYFLSRDPKMLREANFPSNDPIRISDKPAFTTSKSRGLRTFDVIDILFDTEEYPYGLSQAQFQEIANIVEAHIDFHYPVKNEAMILAFFGEAEVISDIDNRYVKQIVGWLSITKMDRWPRVFPQVWFGIGDAMKFERSYRPRGTAVMGFGLNIESMGRR